MSDPCPTCGRPFGEDCDREAHRSRRAYGTISEAVLAVLLSDPYSSAALIAEETGRADRVVRTALSRLHRAGQVERERVDGVYVYRIAELAEILAARNLAAVRLGVLSHRSDPGPTVGGSPASPPAVGPGLSQESHDG